MSQPVGNDRQAKRETNRGRASEVVAVDGELTAEILNVCPDAMGVHCDGRIVLLNDEAARLLGATEAGEIIGRPVTDFINPESREAALEWLRSVEREARRATPAVQRAQRLDGTEIFVEATWSPATYEGRPAALFVARDVSERRRAEERWNLFLHALDEAPDGVQIVGLDGRIIYSNKAVQSIYGFSPEELVGQHVNDMNADPEFADRVILPSVAATGRWDGELTVRHKDRSRFPIWLTASMVMEDDRPIAMIGHIRDVTERRRLEEALRASEERFRLLAENAQDVIYRFRLRPDRAYEYVAPAASTITGYAPEEFYADPTLEKRLIHPDDWPLLERVLENPALFHQPVVQRWIRKDGQEIWSEQRIAPIRDEQGQVVAIEGIARDITDRKRAEDRARQERDRLAAMVETSPVGVIVADAPAGRIVFTNREAQRIVQLEQAPGDELLSYASAAVYHRADGSVYETEDMPLHRALHNGESVRAAEVIIELPDGRSTPTLVNATPVYGADGRIAGAIAVIQDMSPIEELERLRNDFLAMVSHELRTPLTAIKGAAATALEQPNGLDAQEALDLFRIVDDQSSRLRDLISNLMDITRIEAGSFSISPEVMDLTSVCQDARDLFVRTSGGRDVTMSVPADLPPVTADRKRLSQVLTNLLSNAAKFSPVASPIDLTVEAIGPELIVHVRDHGRGIAREKIEHLFKKFSQVHDDAGTSLQGSGLGLAICKGIVEAHGGRIWVESAGEAQGATFSFALPVTSGAAVPPLARPEAPRTTAVNHTPAGPTPIVRRGARIPVLVVDDEVQILRYLRRTLEEAGYEPIVASDPEKVLGLVESRQPALVLMDLRMPGMSGFELLERIRRFSEVPVIFLTASERSEDSVRALHLGADDYMTKPFAPAELLARIEATLRRRVGLRTDRPVFELEGLRINFVDRLVTVNDAAISLSPTEHKLLCELATNAGRVLTHDQLLSRVWGPEYQGATDLLRSFIVLLRRRLGDSARRPRFIFTEPRIGYRMPPGQQAAARP